MDNNQGDVTWLVAAIKRALRPLIRICIGTISCPPLLAVIRELYIEETRRYLKEKGMSDTKSHLSLLTGIDHRAIEQIEREALDSNHGTPRRHIAPEAELLGIWDSDPKYRDIHTGEPRDIPLLGRGPTFQALVGRIARRNVTPRTLLERLTQSGNVEDIGNGMVRLLTPVFAPVTANEQIRLELCMSHFAKYSANLARNMRHGEEESERWFNQLHFTQHLPTADRKAFRAKIRERLVADGDSMLSIINEFSEPASRKTKITGGVGWFYWEEPDDLDG